MYAPPMASGPDPDAPVPCKDHPEARALTRCASCQRPLCNACFRFRVGGLPACARCAYETSTRPQRRVSLAAAFVCFAAGGGFWMERKHGLWGQSPLVLVLGAIAAAVVAFLILTTAKGAERSVDNRDPDEDPPPEEPLAGRGSPYRAYARRAVLAVSPRLSGKVTALVVGASLAATAVLLPATLKLPRWVEAEIVLASWWVIVAATLVVLLYRGFRLRDDFVFFMPWDRPAESVTPGAKPGKPGKPGSKGSGIGDLVGCGDGCSAVDGEGCAGAVVVVIALAVALGAAWIFVELAMPLAFFLTYWLFMRAIGRVANDRHGCDGNPGRALGWGAMWATIYVVPLAALTWAFHALHR